MHQGKLCSICTHRLIMLMKKAIQVVMLVCNGVCTLLHPIDLYSTIAFEGSGEGIEVLFGIPLSELGKLGSYISCSFCNLHSTISMHV